LRALVQLPCMKILLELAFILGVGFVLAGLWWIYPPFAFIAGGGSLVWGCRRIIQRWDS